jgi:hypothetical protein
VNIDVSSNEIKRGEPLAAPQCNIMRGAAPGRRSPPEYSH